MVDKYSHFREKATLNLVVIFFLFLISTFGEEYAWQHRFENVTAARAAVARCIEHHSTQRVHSGLNENTPRHTYLNLCNPTPQQAA